jgi:hypothetical protein
MALMAVEYVTCKICKSSDTLLGKENRLYFITCEACGSSRFQAFREAAQALTIRTIGLRHQGWFLGTNWKAYQDWISGSFVTGRVQRIEHMIRRDAASCVYICMPLRRHVPDRAGAVRVCGVLA